ncbi:MAG: ribonuclease E activity regulator RraA [bacterium]
MKHNTSDLCDHYGSELQVAAGGLSHFGGSSVFHGPITTLRVQQDFLLIKQKLATPGNNQVLVIDGDGFEGCALLGDSLAAMAIENGWSGIVINGFVRDSATLAELMIGVIALGTCPVRPAQAGGGEEDIEVSFAGIVFRPGEYLYADQDGLVTSPTFYK